MTTEPRVLEARKRLGLLLAVAIASIGLQQTAIGSTILWPFALLSTWFHEMGHGLAALLSGNGFHSLVIHADGSGYALTSRPLDGSRLIDAFVSAAGPLGPAIAGSALLLSSKTDAATGTALRILGATLLLSSVIWVRSLVGLVTLPALGIVVLLLNSYGNAWVRRLTIQLLGVQACVSTWTQTDYLFSEGGFVGGEPAASDTSAIADALLLPYWVWGGLLSAVTLAMLAWSLHRALRR